VWVYISAQHIGNLRAKLNLCIELAHAVAKVELVPGDCRTNPEYPIAPTANAPTTMPRMKLTDILRRFMGSNETELSDGHRERPSFEAKRF